MVQMIAGTVSVAGSVFPLSLFLGNCISLVKNEVQGVLMISIRSFRVPTPQADRSQTTQP